MAFYFSPFPFASVLSFSFSAHLLSIFFLYRSLPDCNKNAPFSLSGWITFFIFSIFLQVVSSAVAATSLSLVDLSSRASGYVASSAASFLPPFHP